MKTKRMINEITAKTDIAKITNPSVNKMFDESHSTIISANKLFKK
jgi:hypothetical protein